MRRDVLESKHAVFILLQSERIKQVNTKQSNPLNGKISENKCSRVWGGSCIDPTSLMDIFTGELTTGKKKNQVDFFFFPPVREGLG